MDNNELLMIVLAFVVGYVCSGMMKNMCGGRLVEGLGCNSNETWCGLDFGCVLTKLKPDNCGLII